MVVGHVFSFENNWVSSSSRDPFEVRQKGLLIAVPPAIVLGVIVFWLLDQQDYDQQASRQEQQQQEVARQKQEKVRIGSIVSKVQIGRNRRPRFCSA